MPAGEIKAPSLVFFQDFLDPYYFRNQPRFHANAAAGGAEIPRKKRKKEKELKLFTELFFANDRERRLWDGRKEEDGEEEEEEEGEEEEEDSDAEH